METGHRLTAAVRLAGAVILSGIGYFALARVGLTYTVTPEGIAVIWLPNALLLAVFLTSRYSHWPAFACAALVAEVAADLPAFPLWASLAFGVINLSSTAFAALVLRRFVDPRFNFQQFRHGLAFMLTAPLFSACLAGLFGALVCLALGRAETSYFVLWRVWWFGDALGMLLLTPPLVVMLHHRQMVQSWPAWPALVEMAAAFILIVFVGNHAFLPSGELTQNYFLTPALAVPLVLWLAVRHGLVAASIGVGLFAFQAVRHVRNGLHPFAEASPTFVVLQLQEFLAAITVAAVGLSLLLRELRIQQQKLEKREGALQAQQNVLEKRVRQRTRDLRQANRELHELNARLANSAATDELTGIPNRRGFREQALRYLQRASRNHVPVTLLMLDLDHFKRVNDGYGHAAGDAVLRAVVEPMRDALRLGDLLARTGWRGIRGAAQ